jgi:hypothetical protein
MRKLLFAAFFAFATLFSVGCSDDYNAPVTTRSDFESRYPTATHVEWEKKRGYGVAEFILNGQECEAWYTKSGQWVMTRFDISYSELPEAVRTAFEQSYGTQTPVDDVERLERNGAETIYYIQAETMVNGFPAEVNLEYDAQGTLLRNTVDVDYFDYWDDYL